MSFIPQLGETAFWKQRWRLLMEQFADQLRRQDKAIQVHWYDAGHSGDDMEEAIGQQTMFLEFACKILNSV